jgi:hypothetical protein
MFDLGIMGGFTPDLKIPTNSLLVSNVVVGVVDDDVVLPHHIFLISSHFSSSLSTWLLSAFDHP